MSDIFFMCKNESQCLDMLIHYCQNNVLTDIQIDYIKVYYSQAIKRTKGVK